MPPALLLSRRDVAALLTLEECIAAVEEAFRAYGEGRTPAPGILGFAVPGGGFHIKVASWTSARSFFVAKINANFFENRSRFGLPAIQGIVVLCDGETGTPLALLDSIEITIGRTGAATAVAAQRLARPDAGVATICGCGLQGRVQLRALSRVRRLTRAYAFDIDGRESAKFAAELSGEIGIPIEPVEDLATAARKSDIVVTCTPSRHPLLGPEDLAPGSFLAAVGADSAEKQELDPLLTAACKIVVDILDQCASIGELHHALERGLVRREDVHAELGEIVAGRKPGRTSEKERILFDSTGTALQDAAAAAAVYEKALREGRGVSWRLTD